MKEVKRELSYLRKKKEDKGIRNNILHLVHMD